MASLDLKHINAFRNKRRKNGRVRIYFRRPGSKSIRLPGLIGSDEFMSAYAMAVAGLPEKQPEIGASRTSPGTINALIVSYYKSAAWLHELGEETRKVRRSVIERFRERHGDKRVATLRPDHIHHMLGKIDKPTSRLNWLKAIRHMMQSAVPLMCKVDPTAGITIKLKKTKGHHCWTDDEIEQYRAHWPLGTQQRLVFEFALETASRRGEVVRLGRQHIKNGRIKIARTHGSADVDILMSPALQAAVDAMPKSTHLTYVPISKYSLGNKFREWANAAGLPKRCRMHGLKKAGMTRLAEDGATSHELMAISGHKTLSMVQLYTQDADRRTLADSAMAKRRKVGAP